VEVTGAGAVRVRVTAPPADGAANEAVRDALARALACGRTRVEIVRGHAARTKLVRIVGLTPAEVMARLEAATPSGAPGSSGRSGPSGKEA